VFDISNFRGIKVVIWKFISHRWIIFV